MPDSPAHESPLRLDPETIRRLAHQTAEIIAGYLTGLSEGPPIRPATLQEAEARVGGPLPLDPTEPEEVLAAIARDIAPYGVHNAHPRFFGYVGTSATVSAILADGIAAALNLNVVTSKSRPTAVQVELTVVDWLRQLLGLPEGAGGLLTSGGTMANLLGLAAARQARAPSDVRRDGLYGLPGPLTVYASREAHICHKKSMEILGLGSRYLRSIPTDDQGRMDVAALARAIAADRQAGLHPLAVIATAGTTNHGAVDPLDAIADLCAREQLWLHVDACYGGFALMAEPVLHPDTRRHLQAMARAHSVAADPHKFLYVPVEAGVVLLREPQRLWEAFHVSAEYLVGADHNFFEYGLATSRAFRALKIWASLRHYGSRALGRAIADNIRLARRLYHAIRSAPDLEPLGPEPELSVICFRYVPPDLRERLATAEPVERAAIAEYIDRLNDRLVAALQAGGEIYVSSTVLGGRPVVRFSIVNYYTTAADVDYTLLRVRQLGAEADGALAAERP